MKKSISVIVLAFVSIAAIVWACSCGFSGLAWFPGFFVAVMCGVKILGICDANSHKQTSSR